MSDSTTRPGGDAAAFLAAVEPEARRAEALVLDTLFRRGTDWEPVLWGAGMVGYRRYRYRYKSGREGEALATGFAPRAKKHSIYIMPGYADHGAILRRLGPHRMGKVLPLSAPPVGDRYGRAGRAGAGGASGLRARWPVSA